MSTIHKPGKHLKTSSKTDIVEFYNDTKSAVNTFDEMSSNMYCNCKTKRWPICIFYGMINTILANVCVIYVANKIAHSYFTASCERKEKKEEILSENLSTTEEQPQETSERKICAFCTPKKRWMTRYMCCTCKRFICLEHHGNVYMNMNFGV